MGVAGKIKSIVKGVSKRLSPSYGKDIAYQVGRFQIVLPYGHMLPVYQKGCPQYDRFLPHLAKYLPDNSFVVDVGANCADTLAGMIDVNPNLNFLCIEADNFFYEYLTQNVNAIKAYLPESCIMTVKCLAGSEVTNVIMDGTGGTKKAIESSSLEDNTIQSDHLDRVIDAERVRPSDVSLVKVDTDGYDYDVINSADLLLSSRLPLLFFECQYDNANQKQKYQQLIKKLFDLGYTKWSVFDNFGALLLRTGTKSNILDLIEYVWRQNEGKSHRTTYYLDIFAGSGKDEDLMTKALDNY